MRTGTCARCGRDELSIMARNLCVNCYSTLRRAKKLAPYPKTGQRGRPPKYRPIVGTLPRRNLDWHQIADDRRREIDRLRARIAELEAQHGA